MQTKLITLEVSLRAPSTQLRTALPGSDTLHSDALRSQIEADLSAHGSPLRWAITHIDTDGQTAHVEAVVTTLA